MRASAKILGVASLLLLLAAGVVWYAAIREDRRGELTVSFLDVGAGDAVFIEAPSGRQVLIGGGPDDSVLRQLGQAMPFYDRSIDVVVAADGSSGEVGGLPGVLSRYGVSYILRSGASMPSLDASIADSETRGAHVVVGARGQAIDLGDGAYLEVLSPDATSSGAASAGCLALRLVYGETAFLFPCGDSLTLEDYLATLDGSSLKSDVLFASATSSPLFLGFADPAYVVSADCGDTPAAIFARFGIQTLDTCAGAAVFISDGQTVARE